MNQPGSTNTMTKYLWKKYPAAPRLSLGLTALDIDCSHNIRIAAGASDIMQEKFTASLNAWADTVLYAASLTYFEVGPGFEYMQTGTFNTQKASPLQNHAQKNSKRITFAQTFQEAPTVICWLTAVDMDNQHNWRCRTYATDINTHGFKVHIDTWGDTIMYQAGMNWLAHPGNQPNVASGFLSTDDFRSWKNPQKDNTATVNFKPIFNKTPKLIMALSGFDYDHSKNMRLRLSTSSVTPTAMTWHLQAWADSIMYQASASYFAWA